jgi:hypothetical protein
MLTPFDPNNMNLVEWIRTICKELKQIAEDPQIPEDKKSKLNEKVKELEELANRLEMKGLFENLQSIFQLVAAVIQILSRL